MQIFLYVDQFTLVVTSLLLFVTFVYLYVKYKFNYWKRNGVDFIAPSFPFGNFAELAAQKCPIGVQLKYLYDKSNGPFVGIYAMLRPIMLIRDPELCQNILVKDFSHFHDHGAYCNEEYDPLSGHLFGMTGEKWRQLRIKLNPTFSSAKLKMMFQTLVDCGDKLNEYLSNVADKMESIDMRDISARFTTDIIASVSFGIEVDSINNPEVPFRQMGRKFFKPNFKNGIRMALFFILPNMMNLIRMKFVEDDIEEFIISVVKQTLEHREKNNVQRKDLMQLLIQLRNTGRIDHGDDWNVNVTENKILSLNQIAAQVFAFFMAGFETSTATMSFCLFELAKNQEIQQRVQIEIDEVLAKYDEKLTYDSIAEMKYLEMCINETLRKYPPLPFLNRECTREYKIPGSNVIIQKGTAILLPLLGLQRDAKYYPNPDDFIPERFSAELKNTERPFMPFGDGPRICIGQRMGKMQTKVGLVSMLSKFNFSLNENYDGEELVMDPKIASLCPLGSLELKISNKNLLLNDK